MTSKEEYLKKYLKGGEKKKKIHKKTTKKSVIILDDNPDWRNTGQSNDEDDSDTPIIVEYHDEQKEMEMKARWRPVIKQEIKQEVKQETQSSPSHSYIPTDQTTQQDNRIRHQRHDSDSSPERQQVTSHRSRRDDNSVLTATGAGDGEHDSDPSPPRRSAARDGDDGDSDVSPPRRRQQQQQESSNDANGARRRQERRKDNKLPARATSVTVDSRSTEGTTDHSSRERSNSNRVKMASGGRAGLQSGKDVRIEKQELKDLDHCVSGKGADTIYRNKDGKRIDPKLEKLKKKEEENKKAEQDEQFYEWGRGVAQTRMAHEKIADDIHEMSKPLARYKDDEDLENMLKAREREDDPMLEYIKKKKAKKNVTIDSHGRKRPKKERPMYTGTFPPNRFSIRPGYRWDGIDRSNGFEQSWFAREANKVATAEVAYKWSVEDM